MNGVLMQTSLICATIILAPAFPAAGQSLAELIQSPVVAGSNAYPLPSNFFSGRLNIKPSDICSSAQQVLSELDQTVVVEGECAISSGDLFVMARSEAGQLTSWRIKLNGTGSDAINSLRLLVQVAEGISRRIGWKFPSGLKEAIIKGWDITCTSGAVTYRFSQERLHSGSFNLIVTLNNENIIDTRNFERLTQLCQ